MSTKAGRLSRFWKELKRRHVLRSLAIYAGTAFIVLEAATHEKQNEFSNQAIITAAMLLHKL